MSFKEYSKSIDGDQSKNSDIVLKIKSAFAEIENIDFQYLKLWSINFDEKFKQVRVLIICPEFYQDYLRHEDEDEIHDDLELKKIRQCIKEENELADRLLKKIQPFKGYGWDYSLSEHRR